MRRISHTAKDLQNVDLTGVVSRTVVLASHEGEAMTQRLFHGYKATARQKKDMLVLLH